MDDPNQKRVLALTSTEIAYHALSDLVNIVMAFASSGHVFTSRTKARCMGHDIALLLSAFKHTMPDFVLIHASAMQPHLLNLARPLEPK